jgi:esterase/lipase superfamily enzyme
MIENYYKWHSPALGREIEMQVFGAKGMPVIAFPTSMGRYNQNKDFKLIESAAWFIDNGLIKVYCIDSIDELSWYNKEVHPSTRAYNHSCYDNMIHNELVPRAKAETGHQKVITAGCSFGGYQAANYAFKHPENVAAMISMGAKFSIIDQVDGYYDDTIYYNNPPDFMPANFHPDLWNMKIFLGTAEGDMCLESNQEMSQILQSKGIDHWLDVRSWGGHDWPIWREMFPHYLSLI